jgi:hypothetical protein
MASGLIHGAMVTAVHLIVEAQGKLVVRQHLWDAALTSDGGAVLRCAGSTRVAVSGRALSLSVACPRFEA